MKKIVLILLLILGTKSVAQVPQGISYQAIALTPSGNPVGNVLIGVRLSILDNSASGTVIYTETHTTTTSDRGLYNLIIGQGAPVTGLFPLIDWGTNYKFLKVELDIAGGTNYVLAGTTQLWSVPYALYAETANSVDAANITGNIHTGSVGAFITDSKAYYLFAGQNNNNSWLEQPLQGQPLEIVSDGYTVGVLTSTHAYAATIDNSNINSASWYPIQLSGTPLKIRNSANSIGILTTTHAYVFSYTANANNDVIYNWYAQPISGTPTDIYPFGRGAFGVVTSTNAYAFATTILQSSPEVTASWYSTALNGTVLKIRPNYHTFSVYTPTHAHSFVGITTDLGNTSFEWKSIQMDGTYIDSTR